GKGTLGRLATDPSLFDQLKKSAQRLDEAAASAKATLDAFKKVPLFGKYVEDSRGLLVRPGFERNPKVFKESDLFRPGRATRTADGEGRLDSLKGWLDGLKHKGSEVVVVAYADPQAPDPAVAKTVTDQQSKAVADYLVKQLKAQKMGLLSWSRKVTPLG